MADRKPGVIYRRPWTDPARTETGHSFIVKRACNGCGEPIGDSNPAEIFEAIDGALSDVTAECPFCTPYEHVGYAHPDEKDLAYGSWSGMRLCPGCRPVYLGPTTKETP